MRKAITSIGVVGALVATVASCARPQTQPASTHPAGLTQVQPAGAASWETGSYDPAMVEKVMQLRTRLRAAAATQSTHPFAGQFFQGDGLGMNLTLDIGPSGEYTQTWYGCLGLYYLNHGTITHDGDTIRLHPKILRGDESFNVDLELIRVPWGDRLYLLAPKEMADFVDAVNKRREPRDGPHGMFYVKAGHERFRVEGDPRMPDEHRARLFPLRRAKVTNLGPPRAPNGEYPHHKVRDVTLDIGMRQGVDRDTSFVWPDAKGMFDRVYVIDAFGDSCVGQESAVDGKFRLSVGDEVVGRVRSSE